MEPVLILSLKLAKAAGASAEDIEKATKSPQPVPNKWPVPQRLWMIQGKLLQR